MPFRKLFAVTLAFLLIFVALPAQAQDGDGLSADQQALLDIVAAAQQNFLDLNSYRFTGTQTTTQDIFSGVGIRTIAINQSLEQTFSGDVVQSGDQFDGAFTLSQVITRDITGQADPIANNLDMEFVVTGGEIYVRFTNVPPEDETPYPEGWVTLDEISSTAGLETLNLEALAELSTNISPNYQLNTDTVENIEEIEAEPISGVDIRAFAVTFNTQPALGEMANNLLNDETIDAEMVDQMLESATVIATMYVGVEDNLIYQIDSQLSFDFEAVAGSLGPDPVAMNQVTNSSYTFTDFNGEITVTAPDLGSGEDEADAGDSGDSGEGGAEGESQ